MNAPMECLIACMAAAACWALWFYLIKDYRDSILRNDLFELRDELFSLGSTGAVSFDDRAYKELRLFINGMLRFTHRISLSTLLTAILVTRKCKDLPNPQSAWKASLSHLPETVQKQLLDIHERMLFKCTQHLIRGSIFLAMVIMAMTFYSLIRVFLGGIFSRRTARGNSGNEYSLDIVETFDMRLLETKAYQERQYAEELDLQIV